MCLHGWVSLAGAALPSSGGPEKSQLSQTPSVAGEASTQAQPRWRSGEAESLQSDWTSCSPGAPTQGHWHHLSLLAHLRAQSQFIWRWHSARPWKAGPESGRGIVKTGQMQMEQRCGISPLWDNLPTKMPRRPVSWHFCGRGAGAVGGQEARGDRTPTGRPPD